jgi:hypothetical protein
MMSLSVSRILLALCLAALGAPAWAQTTDPGPPLRLTPSANLGDPPAPAPAKPDDTPATSPPPAASNTGDAPAPAPEGVEAATLAPPDTSWAGALQEDEKPLPPNLWDGTSRGMLRAALPLIGPTTSPALRALSRRLLLSAAVPPPGTDPADGPSLAMLRLQRLAAIGAFSGAITLIDGMPAARRDERVDRFRVELALAANNIPDACKHVAEAISHYQNFWWDRAQIACQVLSGERAKAGLGLDLLSERNAPPDPSFDLLIAAASGKAAKLDKTIELTPLLATLWAASKRALPDTLLAAADLPTLAAFAGYEKGAPAARLAAAERAASLGAMAADKLGEVYAKIEFKDEERADPFSDAKAGDTPRGRALLYAVALKDGDAARRAQALDGFLDGARRHALYFVAARLAAPIIATLTPGDATAKLAPDFIRALVAADQTGKIDPWVAIADGGTMRPLMALLHALDGKSARIDTQAMGEGLAALMLRDKDAAPREIELFQTLNREFGGTIPGEELAPQFAPAHAGDVPSVALWIDQQQAEAAYRYGETVVTSIALVTANSRLTAEPIVLRRAISGLRAMELDADARALALEAALAAGI